MTTVKADPRSKVRRLRCKFWGRATSASLITYKRNNLRATSSQGAIVERSFTTRRDGYYKACGLELRNYLQRSTPW